NRSGVFALVRGQVSPGDECIESRVGHANLTPLKFVVAVPRATRRRSGRTSCWFHRRPSQSVAVDGRAAFLRSLSLLISDANSSQACSIFRWACLPSPKIAVVPAIAHSAACRRQYAALVPAARAAPISCEIAASIGLNSPRNEIRNREISRIRLKISLHVLR